MSKLGNLNIKIFYFIMFYKYTNKFNLDNG